MFTLETERLILRDMVLDDAESFITLSQDAKYQRFYDEADSHPNRYRQLTELFIEQAWQTPRTAFQLAIVFKENQQFIGTVGLRLEGDSQASFGVALARQYQGKGLVQEAAVALADFGFSELNVHRLYGETISKNSAAIRLCKWLGMKKEAHFREHRFFKGQW
ncbi:MAG: GNAT family protein, partial [Thiomicrorhabdus sp.]|nr:GNAT family protein [Thiomicrorhabdus sp.]